MTNRDNNTYYFHNSVKVCQHRNRVNEIKDLSDNFFSSQTNIINYFMNFFRNLWSSSSVHNSNFYFNALLDDFPVLTAMKREVLTSPFSEGEIYRTLISMPHGKSLGPDGLNVEFYIYY